MRLTSVLFLSLALASAGLSGTKCPFIQYTVEGKLVIPQGFDYREVMVFLFLNGAIYTSDYPPNPGEPDYFNPREDGTYTAVAWHNTLSEESIQCEMCDRIPRAASIVIIGEGLYSQRIEVSFESSRRAIRRNLSASVRAPIVVLERLEPSSRDLLD